MLPGDGREGISQNELSKRSKVPQPTISRILKGDGKKGPETATLVALSRALGVDFNWLQQGIGSKHGGAGGDAPAITEVAPSKPEFRRHWLSPEEADHLAIFRSLSPKNQKRIRSMATSMPRDRRDGDAVDEV